MSGRHAAREVLQALAADRQTRRLLRLSFPHGNAPKSMLLVNRLQASEGLSRDFRFSVELLSDNPSIALKDLLGTSASVELIRQDGSVRFFNGIVSSFACTRNDGGFVYYEMVLTPGLAYARLREDCYLFHGKTRYQQTQEILADYGLAVAWDFRVQGPDEPMTEAVQYGETDYNYLHRLWEKAGWHYHYEHRKDGHVLVLGNDTARADPLDGASPEVPWQNTAGSMEDDGIDVWSPLREIVPASVAQSSFDFKSPRATQAEIPTNNEQGQVLRLEVYRYGGAFAFKDHLAGDRVVRGQMEQVEGVAKHVEAQGNSRFMLPGRWFRLTGHPAAGKRDFLVLEVTHEVRNNYLQQAEPAVYRNSLRCTRKTVPWRPGRGFNSTEPKIFGLQTAIVTGPKGEEIFCDEYGRVRIQYHWDRVGRYDEASSAWVRVASSFAGTGFGFMAVPRIGQEVIVQFLDGNPDRPLITGRVFNAHNMPPWPLPVNNTQTGLLSRSTPGGSYHQANAIRFDDRIGAEQLWLHAERDQLIEAENDERHWVGHDRSKQIDHDESVFVGHDRTEVVQNNEKVTVHKNREERVDGDEQISIGGERREDVGKSERIRISDDRSVYIGGNKSETVARMKTETVGLLKALTIGGAYQTTVGAAMNTSVGLSQSEQVGLSKSVAAGQTISFTAGEQFKIEVGESSIVLNADGRIEIIGKEILVRGSNKVEMHGDDVDTNPAG